jgi:hypothetical protein
LTLMAIIFFRKKCVYQRSNSYTSCMLAVQGAAQVINPVILP